MRGIILNLWRLMRMTEKEKMLKNLIYDANYDIELLNDIKQKTYVLNLIILNHQIQNSRWQF